MIIILLNKKGNFDYAAQDKFVQSGKSRSFPNVEGYVVNGEEAVPFRLKVYIYIF